MAAQAPATRPGRTTHRFALIDSVRGLAALSILIFHATFAFGPPGNRLWAFASERSAGPPVTGVVLFFLISGFVLYRPFAEARWEGAPMPALVPYAVRRVARIVPAYWVALLIVSFLLGLNYLHHLSGIVRYFGFLQLYGPLRTVQGGISPAWTLCVEVTFYLALPGLALAARHLVRGRPFLVSELTLCALMLVASLLWQVGIFAGRPPGSWLLDLLEMLPGMLDLFACGMALAAVSVALDHRAVQPRWVELVDRTPWLPIALGLVVFYAVGRLGTLAEHHLETWWILTHELKAVGSLLVLVPLVFGTSRTGMVRRALAWRPLLYLGTISYGLYLWNLPLLRKLTPQLVHHGELFTIVALAVITVAVASLSFYLVEQPSQRLARRYLRGSTLP